MPTKTVIPLSAEDTQKLRKRLIPILLFPLIFAGFVYLIFSQVMSNDQFTNDGVFSYVLGIFGLFFLGIIGYMVWSHLADIRGGTKDQIEGRVTDKRLDIQTSTSHRTGSRGRSSNSTKTTRHYYVYLDGEEFKMDYQHYGKVKVGDHILMERAPKSNMIFRLEVLESSNEAKEVEEAQMDVDFLAAELIEQRFNEEDLTALRRSFTADRRRKLTFMILPGFIAAWFIYTGMWGLLVFLFPIPIILLYQVIGLCRLTLRYAKDKAYGHKTGRTALLEDKLTITGNKTRNRHRLITTQGQYTVATTVYDALSTGD